MAFKYKWWGKGDLDASFGLFFDGFSKVFSAVGIMIFGFGMPVAIVMGKILPAIGIATFLGNLWYFYEAWRLAKKEKRSNVTAQPFGIGGAVVISWLFLIMGPVYWKIGDPMLAFRVGLSAGFIGGIIEVMGAFMGRWLLKVIPRSALMGNMAAGAFVWLSLVGIMIVFDKPEIAMVPLFVVIINYIAKAKQSIDKIPTGVLVIALGTVVAWVTGYMNLDNLISSFSDVGFQVPSLFIEDIFRGFKDVIPYLPIIIPLQIANFLTTLQGVESAKIAGDTYPEKQSMIMDGMFTVIGSLLGNPFPTTVYCGHPSWKAIDARGGYSLVVGITYLIISLTGLTGVMMNVIPYETVMVLLIFVGLSVTIDTVKDTDKKYMPVILIAMLPILVEHTKSMISSAVQAAGGKVENISPEAFAEFNIYIKGVEILGSGAFLSSLLIAGWLACVIDKKYKEGAIFAITLGLASFIGLIHSSQMFVINKEVILITVGYFAIAAITYHKSYIDKPNIDLLEEFKEEKVS